MAAQAGDWPRTTRLLPWLIALIMAIVFLVPFNDIVLDVPLPIDLYFDRLFLPILMGVWAIALAVGGPLAPRIRLTWVHAAIGVFVAVGGLSVVLAARDIQHGLSWDLAIKKLALLGSYVSLFVIVASSVRRSEVRPFMTYTLILGCICAFGLIIEYRFAYNVFYRVSDMVLPGIFQVGDVDSLGVDEIGRREVRGPGQAPLETVAMIAMVLPIVIARLIHPTGERWERAKYGIAAAILLAGTVATFRKSAFMAPISVCLTIAYFRRRELLKLAPLGVVLILFVQALSPGALSGRARPARLEPPRRQHRERSHGRLRRDPPRRVDPPADRPRLRQLRAVVVPDPRHGAAAPARGRRRARGAGLPRHGRGGGRGGAQADPGPRPLRRAGRACGPRRRRSASSSCRRCSTSCRSPTSRTSSCGRPRCSR